MRLVSREHGYHLAYGWRGVPLAIGKLDSFGGAIGPDDGEDAVFYSDDGSSQRSYPRSFGLHCDIERLPLTINLLGQHGESGPHSQLSGDSRSSSLGYRPDRGSFGYPDVY
jgi:hypothetical protein